MSCSATPKLLSYYTSKVNIYDSSCFIKLPDWKTCPAPPCVIISPHIVYPSEGPYIPPDVYPIEQPVNFPGAYTGNIIAPCNTGCTNYGNYYNPYNSQQPTNNGNTNSGCTSCG
jgi:hypothetical protein